ncbi:MAG TPA: tetratricopeptide repeat protein [Phycisphaerae bacterium]|nr:tetratricopeptide repeat protein [Phycisphaerae bacterium]HRY67009.1 tetratricopeptide repeat protein [Phycisphaerae bacterium]HSA28848.1 tetratricopeptide repeat protein [Phycisphaerae bacterium]
MLKREFSGAALAVVVASLVHAGSLVVAAEDGRIGANTPPSSRPAPAVTSPQATTTRPASLESGVVGAALRELYVIPRDSSGQSSSATPAQSASRSGLRSNAGSSTGRPSTAPAAEGQRKGGGADARSTSPQVMDLSGGTSARYHSGRRLSTNEREWATYRYFGGQPSRYGYGMYGYDSGGDRGYGPYYGYGHEEGDVYRFGFMQGYDKGKFDRSGEERAESVAAHASLNVSSGLQFFRKGDFRRAADAYQLAAELDQGDPAARLCAGHALFALGRYREACRFIRRAFELQPRIAYLAYDIRGDYEDRAVFDDHLRALRKALELAPRDPDRLFMLGYVLYYSNQRAQSYPVFAQLLQVDRNDKLAFALYRNAQPSDVEVDAAKAVAPPAPAR